MSWAVGWVVVVVVSMVCLESRLRLRLRRSSGLRRAGIGLGRSVRRYPPLAWKERRCTDEQGRLDGDFLRRHFGKGSYVSGTEDRGTIWW